MPLNKLKTSLSRMDKSELEELNTMGRSALHFAARLLLLLLLLWLFLLLLLLFFCCCCCCCYCCCQQWSVTGTAKWSWWHIYWTEGWRSTWLARRAWRLSIMFQGGELPWMMTKFMRMMRIMMTFADNVMTWGKWAGKKKGKIFHLTVKRFVKNLILAPIQIRKDWLRSYWLRRGMLNQCEKLHPGPFHHKYDHISTSLKSKKSMTNLFSDDATAPAGGCGREQGGCLQVKFPIQNVSITTIVPASIADTWPKVEYFSPTYIRSYHPITISVLLIAKIRLQLFILSPTQADPSYDQYDDP